MSQEYTEDKEVTLGTLSGGRRVLEALLMLVALFAVWLMAALLSFNPSDPSWSQTAWHEPIHNICGRPGAWLADTLFFIFGVMAYTLPVMLIGGCWFTWRHRASEDYIDYFAVALRLIGVLALILTSCGLAAMNADDIWYFASGGVIGSLLSTAMKPLLTGVGGTIALMCLWAAGLTLFTGWSWVGIAEKIGNAVLTLLTFASNRTRRDDTWQDDEEYNDEFDDEDYAGAIARTETRRARILRDALARKQRVKEKFVNPVGRHTDRALFSGRRMDDPDEVRYSARGVEADADDVLFTSHSVAQADIDPDDPLFSGHSIAIPAADAAVADWAEPAAERVQQAATLTPAPQAHHHVMEWQPVTGRHTPEPAIMPASDDYDTPPITAGRAPENGYADSPRFSAPQSETAVPWTYAEVPEPNRPVSEDAPQYEDDRQWHAQPTDAESFSVASEPATHFAPESEQKPSRPPLWHFEEVEAQRAREREQLAAWYRPVPDLQAQPEDEHTTATPRTSSLSDENSARRQDVKSATSTWSTPVFTAGGVADNVPDARKSSMTQAASVKAAFTPVFDLASDLPRPQVKEGLGPQLPRPNRVRLPTRRERASYGIKLPSQRIKEEARAAQQHDAGPADVSEEYAETLHQNALAQQFAAQQHQRYADMTETSLQQETLPESENAAEELSALAHEFAAQQQKRYSGSSGASLAETAFISASRYSSASASPFMPTPDSQSAVNWHTEAVTPTIDNVMPPAEAPQTAHGQPPHSVAPEYVQPTASQASRLNSSASQTAGSLTSRAQAVQSYLFNAQLQSGQPVTPGYERPATSRVDSLPPEVEQQAYRGHQLQHFDANAQPPRNQPAAQGYGHQAATPVPRFDSPDAAQQPYCSQPPQHSDVDVQPPRNQPAAPGYGQQAATPVSRFDSPAAAQQTYRSQPPRRSDADVQPPRNQPAAQRYDQQAATPASRFDSQPAVQQALRPDAQHYQRGQQAYHGQPTENSFAGSSPSGYATTTPQHAQPGKPQRNASSYNAQPQSALSSQPVLSQESTSVPRDSLIHPLLMRNGEARPAHKPATPLPSLDLLTSPPAEVEPIDSFALQQMARLVEARLADFRIKADVVNYSPGPVITRFELNLAPGVKAARISNLSRDLARSLSTVAVRVVEVIPGKPYVGLELPNKKRQTVYLREVLDCAKFKESPSPLSVVLGKDIAGEPVVADLAKMPHLLVAGTTGSGKSVGVNAMILSMLFKATPDDVRFIMIDPKMLELSVYEGIPHLLTEVVTDMKDAANALRWSVHEMERRYKLMSALGVRNLAGYNEKILEAERMGRPIPDPYWKPGDSMEATHPVLQKLPYIVVLVDEFADLMMTVGKKVEELIARLAQKARAAGIHLVLATQRPSVDVITGLIKANIPTRIAFTVSSKIDSRTILDQGGAESLLGMGDMLYSGPNSTMPVRVHGAFVRDEEVHAVVQDWKARGRPQYVDGITSDSDGEGSSSGFDSGEELDALFDQAVAFVVEKRKASISGVQRQFRIGYNRAARIIEQMEVQGIVSAQGHNGNREVLAPPPFD